VLGKFGAGKTSLIAKYLRAKREQQYE